MDTKIKRILLLAMCAAGVQSAWAAPQVTRLTPASALFSVADPRPPYISRFMAGQRFDVQATISPDPGQTITNVTFRFNDAPSSLPVTAVFSDVAGKPANTVVATVRAYSTTAGGEHRFTVVAYQSDGQEVAATGNYEVLSVTPTGWAAKKIILLIGDGMGIAHRTAGRIMKNGVTLGKANAALAMDTFPNTALVTTHSLNSIVTDSSPGASCYATGNKANNNQHGVFPDDTISNGDNPRIESMGEYLHRTQGRSLGVVTTTDVFDSTPAAFGSHTQARTAGTGIIDEFLDSRDLSGLKVLMGGGRRWFLPNNIAGSTRSSGTDYVIPAELANAWGIPGGVIDPARNVLQEFIDAGFHYAWDATTLNNIPTGTDKLLGLFHLSNMNVAKDKIDGRRNPGNPNNVVSQYNFPDQPMLDEMAAKALEVLNQNPAGFLVMIEGGSIDKQAHLMDSDRMVVDVIEFDRTIDICRQFALTNSDTLVIVTADHECGGANIIGASRVSNAILIQRAASGGGTSQLRNGVVGTLDQAAFPNYGLMVPDGYPATTDIDFKMLIGYACNADRYEDWLFNPLPMQNSSHGIVTTPPIGPQNPLDRDHQGNYLVTGQIADVIATHTASDIPLSAMGRNSGVFSGVMDNTDIFFKMVRIAVGDASLRQELSDRIGHPGGVEMTPNGSHHGASLRIDGQTGGNYSLEYSSDLVSWSELFQTNLLAGPVSYNDSSASSHRFYRLVWR